MSVRFSPERSCLVGGGEAGERLRAIDWAGTALGPVEGWPLSLQATVRIVLSSAFPMMLHWGPDLVTIYNDAYAPSLGRKHPGHLGRPARDWWPEMWDQLTPIFEQVLAGEPYLVEDARYTPDRDGTPQDAYFTNCHSPLWDDDGRIAGIFLVVTETTRRVVAEHDLNRLNRSLGEQVAAVQASEVQLRESKQRLDALIRSSSEVRYSISADWSELHQLAGGGFIPDTAPGNTNWLDEYIPAQDRAAVRAEFERAIRTKSDYSLEHRVNRVDGTVGWAFSRAVPLLDPRGEVTGWLGAASDITDQRRAEMALQALNATLAEQVRQQTQERNGLWEVSRDLFMVTDGDGVILSLNPAWTTVLGWEEAAFVGRTTEWLEHPDDQVRTRAEIDHLVAGQVTLAFENRFRAKDGDYVHLSWTAVPSEGLLYCSARDVTESRRQAGMLLQAEDALRQSQKMEAVGQLTGGVAHDFNNLLTVIKSSTDLLKRPDLAEERRVRYIAAISDTVDRAAKLTGQLLAFARRQALRPEVFDAAVSVRAIADMVGTLTGARISVRQHLSDEPCFINADPSQFDTALVNMAVNARDAMDGEGELTIGVRPAEGMPAVRSHAAVTGDYVEVSIQDTGSGIAPDKLGRIFEPFFTTKEVGQGTGLGLSQVYGFAKQSGGEIMVESEVGTGTTFTLYLPRASASRQRVRQEEDGPITDGGGASVLVVEDNRDVGTFVTQTLTELGYRTHWVLSARAGLDELAREPHAHDVVFSDVVMPSMNGVELGREIGRLYPRLPVILTSGYSHVLAQDGDHGFELLQKPYSVEALSRVLGRAMRKRRDG
ncbi:PAS domain-containing sensor histidine kinase [Methylobacterium sp. SI9]|uniref:hybrid sensor histidine kinase/response regulator n=1 Tax=Methylobacterium guangdongense TaxID=3138811 RepID=UPI00313DEAFC